jgi:oligo-1,6-glucosidase/alpha-glucosidase
MYDKKMYLLTIILLYEDKKGAYEREYPNPLMPVVVFSNHDQFCSIKRVGNDVEKAKLLTVLKMTLRAVPTTYYGEEIGMPNQLIPVKNAQDTMAKTFSWIPQFIVNLLPVPVNRDACRTPMQWNSAPNAGFSTAEKTWLPIHPNYKQCNVAAAQQDKNSIYYTYAHLLQIRKNNTCLQSGTIEIVDVKNPAVLAYKRKDENGVLLILINFKNKKQRIQIPENISVTNFVFGIKSSAVDLTYINGMDAVIWRCG